MNHLKLSLFLLLGLSLPCFAQQGSLFPEEIIQNAKNDLYVEICSTEGVQCNESQFSTESSWKTLLYRELQAIKLKNLDWSREYCQENPEDSDCRHSKDIEYYLYEEFSQYIPAQSLFYYPLSSSEKVIQDLRTLNFYEEILFVVTVEINGRYCESFSCEWQKIILVYQDNSKIEFEFDYR